MHFNCANVGDRRYSIICDYDFSENIKNPYSHYDLLNVVVFFSIEVTISCWSLFIEINPTMYTMYTIHIFLYFLLKQ